MHALNFGGIAVFEVFKSPPPPPPAPRPQNRKKLKVIPSTKERHVRL